VSKFLDVVLKLSTVSDHSINMVQITGPTMNDNINLLVNLNKFLKCLFKFEVY
jgi:hypothetical protein